MHWLDFPEKNDAGLGTHVIKYSCTGQGYMYATGILLC